MMSWARASEEQKISLSDRRAALFDYVLLLLLLPARNAVVVVVDRGDCILITLRAHTMSLELDTSSLSKEHGDYSVF